MKLIVMGAGYVGMALLKDFQNQSFEIAITTTQKEKVETLKSYGTDVLLLDSKQDANLKNLINTSDGIIILVAPGNSQNYEETYLHTSKRICSLLKDRKTPFYLLYTSSTFVCEGQHDKWVTEEMDLNPPSENAKILLETEHHYLNCGVESCILRLGGIYGPQRELIDRALRFSGLELPGSGDESTNHIHLDDIVDGIKFCLCHRLTGVYQLVNDDHRTRKQLYSELCESVQIPLPFWKDNHSQSRRGGYRVSNQKIKGAGFVFKYPLLQIKMAYQ
jgi:nucleoside-diphosphate-sugar epimerase